MDRKILDTKSEAEKEEKTRNENFESQEGSEKTKWRKMREDGSFERMLKITITISVLKNKNRCVTTNEWYFLGTSSRGI